MMQDVGVTRIAGDELPIPKIWRSALKQLVDSVVMMSPLPIIDGFIIDEIDKETLLISRENIDDYPDPLGPLAEISWETSICIWVDSYWQILVDLTSHKGDVSDLVFHAKITETDNGYSIEPGLVYVP